MNGAVSLNQNGSDTTIEMKGRTAAIRSSTPFSSMT
jgi:hypothetical protein